ncbi:MAG: helix-turn-helix transcriptional regulator [Candidatus Aminicenantes bacterium]|nr:helix-turn-helix transcriptional regulator [Candidatus Aminicenantes bacterium]
MFFQPFVVYSLAFLLGFGAIALGHLLQRRYQSRFAFVSDYFIYLTAAVTYGLFNWIGPFLVMELSSGFEQRTIFFIYLVLGALGIPLLFVKIYFLFALVIRWMGRGVSVGFKAVFGLCAFITLALYFLDTRQFILYDKLTPGRGNIFYVGVFSIGIQFLILVVPLLPSRIDSPPNRSLRLFCVISLICYSLYTAAAYTDFLHMTSLFYYLLLLPPLIFVWTDLRKIPSPRLPTAMLDKAAVYAQYKLTPRERQIVDLVLQGKKNRQVGKHLHLSLQSVKNALTRVYRKVDVSSRSELISRLMRLDRMD